MKLHKRNYAKYRLYTFDEKIFQVLEKIVKKEYKVEAKLVHREHCNVTRISIDATHYVLKKIVYGTSLKRRMRKYLTFFKKGNALKDFLRVERVRAKGFPELAENSGVGVYKKGIIHDQFILMPYIDGRATIPADFLIVEAFLKKLHLAGMYHGDVHPGNFMLRDDGTLAVLDTKLKRLRFGNYSAHQDMQLLHHHFDVSNEYPYKKNFLYYFAGKRLRRRLPSILYLVPVFLSFCL